MNPLWSYQITCFLCGQVFIPRLTASVLCVVNIRILNDLLSQVICYEIVEHESAVLTQDLDWEKIISNKTCHEYLCKENLPIAPRFFICFV